jgi:hypothetical protein
MSHARVVEITSHDGCDGLHDFPRDTAAIPLDDGRTLPFVHWIRAINRSVAAQDAAQIASRA